MREGKSRRGRALATEQAPPPPPPPLFTSGLSELYEVQEEEEEEAWWIRVVRRTWQRTSSPPPPPPPPPPSSSEGNLNAVRLALAIFPTTTTAAAAAPTTPTAEAATHDSLVAAAAACAEADGDEELAIVTNAPDVARAVASIMHTQPVGRLAYVTVAHDRQACVVYARDSRAFGVDRRAWSSAPRRVLGTGGVFNEWSWFQRVALATEGDASRLCVLAWARAEDADDVLHPDRATIPTVWLAVHVTPALHGRARLVLMDDGGHCYSVPTLPSASTIVATAALVLLWRYGHVRSRGQMTRALDAVPATCAPVAAFVPVPNAPTTGVSCIDLAMDVHDAATRLVMALSFERPAAAFPLTAFSPAYVVLKAQADLTASAEHDPACRVISVPVAAAALQAAVLLVNYWLFKWRDPTLARTILWPAFDKALKAFRAMHER